MERATQKDERGYYLVGDGIYSDEGTPEKFRGDDVDRLAAYEDTGLEPCDYSAMAHALEQAERAREDLTEMIRQIGATGLDRLRELAQADNEGRCVVLDDLTVSDLHQMLTELTAICYGDGEETYTTGYRNGRKNGKIEILRSVLGVHEGASEKAEAALEGMKNG